MENLPNELRNSTWFHKSPIAVKLLAEVTDSKIMIHCNIVSCPGTCDYLSPFCRRCGREATQSKTLINAIIKRFNTDKTEKQQEYLCSNSRIFERSVADETCSICLCCFSPGEQIHETSNCGHLFHPKCMHQWIKESNSCPLCRTEIPDCVYSPKSILAHSGYGSTFVFCQ